MASWLLLPLPSFPWLPPPPPPGSSSGGRGGGGGGGDGGDWRPNVVAAFAGAQVGRALRSRFSGLLRSPEVRHLEAWPKMDDVCFGGSLATHPILGVLGNVFRASFVCNFTLFNGNGSGGTYIGKGKVLSRRPRRIDSKKRLWTNVLLAINVLAYIAQVASEGKLLMWGAKVCAPFRISHSFNCFSLNSIGPMVEMLTGPRRFIAVYFSSALTGSLMSYRFCESPAVGASGAIFGLVGAYAVYMWRHRSYSGNARESLEHIARVVVLNMVLLDIHPP
nr:unnamed protein product [Digitaria exilis]